jgi:hypothetical protein
MVPDILNTTRNGIPVTVNIKRRHENRDLQTGIINSFSKVSSITTTLPSAGAYTSPLSGSRWRAGHLKKKSRKI